MLGHQSYASQPFLRQHVNPEAPCTVLLPLNLLGAWKMDRKQKLY